MDDRSEWLDWRRNGIGGSDVAGILGLSSWASPYSVWADKVGLTPDQDQSEAMEMGLALEGAISDLFHARTGLYVVGAQTRVEHDGMPWARATLDGMVSETSWRYGDEPFAKALALGNLEAKTTSESPAAWENGIPDMYACQVQWQMFVTGAERTWVACIHASFGLKFRIYEMERDEDDIAVIVERVTQFWNDHVLTGIPPEADGTSPTTEALRHLPADPDMVVGLDDLIATIAHLQDAKRDLKETELFIAGCENKIKAAMGEATEATVGGMPVASWRPQSRTTLDTKALRADLPDLASKYETTTTSRVFRLATKKEN